MGKGGDLGEEEGHGIIKERVEFNLEKKIMKLLRYSRSAAGRGVKFGP